MIYTARTVRSAVPVQRSQKEKGLEPLANLILLQKMTETPLEEAKKYINPERSQHRRRCLKRCKRYPCRVGLRQCRFPYPYPGTDYEARTAFIRCKDPEAESVYEMYYEFSESLSKLAGHRILAISRGEKEKFLTVKLMHPWTGFFPISTVNSSPHLLPHSSCTA